MKKTDWTGKRVGKLTVLEDTERKDNSGYILWKCKCDCGNTVERSAGYLRTVKTGSCGCYMEEWNRLQRKDITGQRFGKLVAIEPTGAFNKQRQTLWKMKCDCGKEIIKSVTEVSAGTNPTRSCGCTKSGFIGNSRHGKQHYENLKKNYVFGTNINHIRRTDDNPTKANTSGYQGVSYLRTRGIWRAGMRFQGMVVLKDCHSLEDAILERQRMRRVRDEFIDWFDSLSEEEQEIENKKYQDNRKQFQHFYRKRYRELTHR